MNKPPEKSSSNLPDFGRFFVVALIIFIGFLTTNAYVGGRSIFSKSKNLAFAGYDDLKSGIHSLTDQDFEQAIQFFSQSQIAFESMEDDLLFLTNQANTYLDQGLYLEAAEKLIQSGVSVSKIGQELSNILDDAQIIPTVFIRQNQLGDESIKLTDLIRLQYDRLKKVLSETVAVQQNITTLNTSVLPGDLKAYLKVAQENIGIFLGYLREIDRNFKTFLTLLGDEVPHNYLILFQNNHELRATGGFIGSYMLLNVNDGKVTKMEVKDVYESDGQLTEVLEPPPGIDRISDRLYMRDANYSPDFPTSARQIMWLLEHSRGPSVDTVIAIDQTVAESLLRLTGSMTFSNLPFEVTADNFNDLLSFNIESKLSDTVTPKQILIDFLPIFKEHLFKLEKIDEVAGAMIDLMAGRHIQMYSADSGVQAMARRLNIDGRIIAAEPGIDYLSIITTAIGGNKSDAFIQTVLTHHTQVGNLGQVTDYLIIEKTHTWQESDFDFWKELIGYYGTGQLHESTLRFIHGEGDNVDYMRVYVPQGSRLISLDGVNINDLKSYDDLGYTVFAFTFGPVSAGQSKSVGLVYQLPFELMLDDPVRGFDVYKFIAQKQAGAENITLNKSLETSDFLQILETHPKIPEDAFALYPKYQIPLDQNHIFLSAIAAN